ncbi:MAG TPA: hypothetical protein VGE07_07380 [Herpetosiphonaceae bacterium]
MTETNYRGAVQAAADALRQLHRGLTVAARRMYEDANQTQISATDLFHQLKDNPAFAWLQPLTSLVSRLDDLPQDAELGAAEAAAVRREAMGLINPPEGEDTAFYDQLYQARSFAPELVVLHAHARAAVGALPAETGDGPPTNGRVTPSA